MAIKLVDELKAMGNFPIAHAEGINLVKTDGTEDNLQNLFDNGELGGGDTSLTVTEAEYLALPEEQKLNNSYYLYDIGVHYKNGVAYSRKKPIQLTMEEYKALVEVDPDQEYIVSANEQGILLEASDIGYSNAVSNLPCTTVQGAIDKVVKNGVDRYSTDEVKTNKVWIDGKPIYRKVIDFGTLPKNTLKEVPHGISNIDVIVSLNGITFTNSKTATPIPYTHSNSANEVSLFIEGTNIDIRTFGDKTPYINTYVTLEYTKTTD